MRHGLYTALLAFLISCGPLHAQIGGPGTLETAHKLRHGGRVFAVAFCPRSGMLASAGPNEIKFWDRRGKLQTTIKMEGIGSQHGMPGRLAFSPDGKLIAVGGKKAVAIWQVDGPKHLKFFEAEYEFPSVAFSPDGKTLTFGGKEGVICWKIKTDEVERIRSRSGDFGYHVAYSPDSSRLAWGGDDDVVVWDLVNRKQVSEFKERARYLAFHPTRNILAWTARPEEIGTGGGLIKLWDGREVDLVQTHFDHPESCFAFAPDGASIFVSYGVIDLKSGLLVRRGNWEKNTPFALNSDGTVLASVLDPVVRHYVGR